MRALFWMLLSLAAVACSEEPTPALPAELREVIDGATWQAIPRADDPFIALLPAAVTDCASSGVVVEDAMLEMDTGLCGFISAETTLTESVAKGERIQITLWHLALYAEPPAKGELRIHIGGAEVYRLEVDIPHLEQVYRPEFKAPSAWPKNTKVEVHVHNHGANTWKVYQITAGG